MPSRIPQFDYMRNISAAGVIAIHVFAARNQLPAVDDQYLILTFIQRLFVFAVPLFLFMSGYLLSRSPVGELRHFYAKRIPPILVPYAVVFIFYLALRVHGTKAIPTPEEVLFLFASANVSIHLWFVPVILQLYLLHPLLARLPLTKQRGPIILALLFIAKMAWIVFLTRRGMHFGTGFYPIFVVQGLFYYVLGMYFQRNSTFATLTPSHAIRLAALSAITFLTAFALISVYSAQAGNSQAITANQEALLEWLYMLFSTALIPTLYVALTAIERRISEKYRVVAANCAGCTYFVYLTHMLVLPLFKASYRQINDHFYADYTYYIACFSIVLLTSYLAGFLLRARLPAAGRLLGLR